MPSPVHRLLTCGLLSVLTGAFGALLVPNASAVVHNARLAGLTVHDAPLRSAELPTDRTGFHTAATPPAPAPVRKAEAHAARPTAHRAVTRHPARRAHHARIRRWTPSGTGMWIYQWSDTSGGNGAAVVRKAELAGLSTLYVRTGSSWDGFTGAAALRALLPRVGPNGPAIVVWDFPNLRHPGEDALRLARAATFGRGHPGWAHVVAVAPDIETPAEGTDLTAARVQWYLGDLRKFLPRDVSILATVPWPSVYRVGSYPYALIARYSDAFLPMAYWYNNSAYKVTYSSVRYLDRFGKPVIPVGQGYNEQVDDPYLPPSHQRPELVSFLTAASRSGAPGVSLWSWQLAGPTQWGTIHAARRYFPRRSH